MCEVSSVQIYFSSIEGAGVGAAATADDDRLGFTGALSV